MQGGKAAWVDSAVPHCVVQGVRAAAGQAAGSGGGGGSNLSTPRDTSTRSAAEAGAGGEALPLHQPLSNGASPGVATHSPSTHSNPAFVPPGFPQDPITRAWGGGGGGPTQVHCWGGGGGNTRAWVG